MKCTIEIQMDNAAFEARPGRELARILNDLFRRVEDADVQDGLHIGTRDINGNRVGYLTITDTE